MQIAQTISFRRAGKGARRIIANFTGTASETADIIAVDGTEDFRRLNKSVNQWTSRCKYTTLELTLIYLDLTTEGLKLERASYDKTGKLISNITENAAIIDLAANVDSGTLNVSLSWQSTEEIKIRQYSCFREDPNAGSFEGIGGVGPTGAGSKYITIDGEIKERGTYNYYVFAQFESTDPLKDNGKLVGVVEEVIV